MLVLRRWSGPRWRLAVSRFLPDASLGGHPEPHSLRFPLGHRDQTSVSDTLSTKESNSHWRAQTQMKFLEQRKCTWAETSHAGELDLVIVTLPPFLFWVQAQKAIWRTVPAKQPSQRGNWFFRVSRSETANSVYNEINGKKVKHKYSFKNYKSQNMITNFIIKATKLLDSSEILCGKRFYKKGLDLG